MKHVWTKRTDGSTDRKVPQRVDVLRLQQQLVEKLFDLYGDNGLDVRLSTLNSLPIIVIRRNRADLVTISPMRNMRYRVSSQAGTDYVDAKIIFELNTIDFVTKHILR